MEIPVGQLEVIVYVPVECPTHPDDGWALGILPVAQCAYYQSAKTGNEQPYDEYMNAMERRHPNAKAEYPYQKFKELVDEIRADGGYRCDRVGPVAVYKGTMWVEDGHHRAAIICALFGPDYQVPVTVSGSDLPTDVGRRCNRCEP
jgi:hypothetical protein